jgi:transposase
MAWWWGKKRQPTVAQENARLRAENARLRADNAQLLGRVAELEAQNAGLVAQLSAARKDSHNSSKPPSSDVVKPPRGQRPRGRSKRKIGGQKGHPKHQRPPFAPDQVDQRIPHRLERCPVDPTHRIRLAEGSEYQRVLQQVELVKKPFRVVEHTAYSIWCQDCGCYHQAPLPEALVKAGLFGPRLTSLAVYLKGRIHASYSGMRDFFQEVMGIEVSRGYLAKLLRKASQAFGPSHGELLELLPLQTHLNVDETGHKEKRQRYWIWCFRAASFVVFKIDPSRGTEVLMRILGEEFQGILGCDYYAAYRKYARQCSVLVQFCLAHLIRDVKYLCEFPDPSVQRYGRGLLAGLQALFGTLHRKDELSATEFEARLDKVYAQIWKAALPGSRGPCHRLIWNMAERFAKHGDAYFQFITHPDIDPTNNVV